MFRFMQILLVIVILACTSFTVRASELKSREHVMIASIDTEQIVAYFSKKFNLTKKIMQEYTDYLDSNAKLRLTVDEKNALAEKQLDKITSQYVSVIMAAMNKAINNSITKHKITVLTHKTLFDLKHTLFNTSSLRNSQIQEKNDYLQACEDYFKHAVIVGPSETKEITKEVLAVMEANLSHKSFTENSTSTGGHK